MMKRRYGEIKEITQAESDTAAAGKGEQKQLTCLLKCQQQSGLVQQELLRPDGSEGSCSTAEPPDSEETSRPDAQRTSLSSSA